MTQWGTATETNKLLFRRSTLKNDNVPNLADLSENHHQVTSSASDIGTAVYNWSRMKKELTKVQSHNFSGIWKISSFGDNEKLP